MAKSLGTTVAVLVVKHELGFCLWQSEANPYCLKASPWRAGHDDVLRDFVESCRKHGLKPGVFTEARVDARLGIDNFNPLQGAAVTRAEYSRLLEPESPGNQVAENAARMLSQFGGPQCHARHRPPSESGLRDPRTRRARCAEFGRWISDTFRTPLAKTSGSGDTLTLDIPALTNGTDRKPAYIVIREDLRQGERVRAYSLEREENGRWSPCFEGRNIGHKRIVPLTDGVAARRYRLRGIQSRDVPQIRLFAAY